LEVYVDALTSFGLWLKQRRQALNLTQADLARCVGYSVAAIRKIEADERRPSRQGAELLADCLDIPLAERPTFLKVIRAELRVDHLATVSPTEPTSHGSAAPPPRLTPPLPAPPTPLVGREHELATIARLLQDANCRLLTLVGPGGIGKTRLALETAHHRQPAFAGDVYFVSLAGVGSAEFLIPAIADGLGFAFAGPTDPKAQLLNYLRHKPLLLVLDNLEHLLGAEETTTGLRDMLQVAPALKLLVTSRERLNLQGEWVFEVQGLPLPPTDQTENLEAYSAITLFVQSARRLQADFDLTAETQPAVARICRLLEGLPLGIELAAAWVRTLSCREIASEIEAGLDFLAASMRDAPERHRSITAVFDHSWKLLTGAEQRVLRQLSVFRGGFRREAAKAVAGATLPILSALLDKSLLRHSAAGRYDLHELIRQYAASHLSQDAQEEHATRDRHSHYYLTLLETHQPALISSRQKEALVELDADLDNLRAAWDTAVAYEQIDLLRDVTWLLYYFYELHDYFQEGEARFRRGAEMAQARLASLGADSAGPERARWAGGLGDMLAHQAFFNLRLGRNGEAARLYRASIALLRPLDETFILAHALLHYGLVCWVSSDFEEASRSLDEGLPLKGLLEHPWLQACFSAALGVVAHERGDYAEAYHLLHEGLTTAQGLGDPHLISFCGNLFARTAQALGRATEVEQVLREGLSLVKETGDRWSVGLRLEQMAVAAQAREDYAEARRLFDESTMLYREIDDRWSWSRVLNLRGYFALLRGEEALARADFRQAIQIALAADVKPNVLDGLAGLALLSAQKGHYERALELATHVRQHPASPQEAKDRAEKLRAEVEDQLTPQQLESVQTRIQARSFEAVVQEILDTDTSL
jgi:predicted ATPase/transcriptional regulator with XRE-family HTH domain